MNDEESRPFLLHHSYFIRSFFTDAAHRRVHHCGLLRFQPWRNSLGGGAWLLLLLIAFRRDVVVNLWLLQFTDFQQLFQAQCSNRDYGN